MQTELWIGVAHSAATMPVDAFRHDSDGPPRHGSLRRVGRRHAPATEGVINGLIYGMSAHLGWADQASGEAWYHQTVTSPATPGRPGAAMERNAQ